MCNNLPLSLHPVIKPSLIASYFSQRFWALVDLILFIIINICIVTNIAFHNHIMSGCFHWHGVLNLSFKIWIAVVLISDCLVFLLAVCPWILWMELCGFMEAVSQSNCVKSHQTLTQMFLPFFFSPSALEGKEEDTPVFVKQVFVCLQVFLSFIRWNRRAANPQFSQQQHLLLAGNCQVLINQFVLSFVCAL